MGEQMTFQYLCFIYKFIEEPGQSGFRIIGVHDHIKPWTAIQLAANGLITQKYVSRTAMENAVESMAKKLQVTTYCLLSINEYNALLEDSHQVDDFRKRLQSKEKSLFGGFGQKVQNEPSSTENQSVSETHKSQGGFFTRLFGQDNS